MLLLGRHLIMYQPAPQADSQNLCCFSSCSCVRKSWQEQRSSFVFMSALFPTAVSGRRLWKVLFLLLPFAAILLLQDQCKCDVAYPAKGCQLGLAPMLFPSGAFRTNDSYFVISSRYFFKVSGESPLPSDYEDKAVSSRCHGVTTSVGWPFRIHQSCFPSELTLSHPRDCWMAYHVWVFLYTYS